MQLDFFNAKILLLFLCLRKPINQSLGTSCSRFGTVPIFSKDETNQPVPEYGVLGGQWNHRLSRGRAGRPVPEHLTLGGRYSPQDAKWTDWSTSPRASHARWSVQSPGCRMGRQVDQSPSMSCSVVSTVPRMSNGQTGRPVPEHVMLGGRYSPQVYHVCLTKSPTFLLKKPYRRINVRCDRASCHIVRLLHKKVPLVTVQPLFAQSKKRKPSIMQKSHYINCDNY